MIELLHISNSFAEDNIYAIEQFEGATYMFLPIQLPDGRYFCSENTVLHMPLLFLGYNPVAMQINTEELPIYTI